MFEPHPDGERATLGARWVSTRNTILRPDPQAPNSIPYEPDTIRLEGFLTMSVTIEAGTKHLTLLNVYEVKRARQQQLIDLLNTAAKELAQLQRGLISFVIHRSFDGARVVTYSQWTSREAFEAAVANPAARRHIDAAMAMAVNILIFCEVVSVYEAH